MSPPVASPPLPAITVRLKAGREAPVRDGHPWVFSGAVAAVEGPEEPGVARVVGADGRGLGSGFYSPRSQIRVRMVTGPGDADRAIDRELFAARLASAVRLRERVVPAATTGYRVVNAEGDGLPGWIVDRFGMVLVSQVTSAGLEVVRGEAYEALGEAFPDHAIVQANDAAGRRAEGLGPGDEPIAGEAPAEAPFHEHGLAFAADLAGGQKTGFYCDQRENRRLAERLAGGRSVLDLFAHSGAFALYALRGGAAAVACVESSPRLVEHGRRHLELNPELPGDRVEWVRANVFEDLRRREGRYGLVICDPPPLARRRGDVERAARAYKDLNRLAFARLEPGGFLLTFSCSGAVDAKLFRQVLFAAAVEAGVRVRLLAPLAAAPDHPVAITHREGEYLKGWWCEVAG
jgi:23S rRNA (cytosine1962-C5)-methyltransferase